MEEITNNPPTETQSFYAGQTIFLTGASGFLGKIMLEKLLRSCPDIKKIYILLRAKKDKDSIKRFNQLFETVIFENLNKTNPGYKKKVSIITGDCCLPDLGLQEEGKQILLTECTVILHWAATVKFDENLKVASNINVRAVRDLINFAKKMPQLKSFLYVSTAFSNCTRQQIDEEFYEPIITAEQLINIMDALDAKLVADITPHLLGRSPNTYVFTKCIAENMVKIAARGLPIGVFRPSIVVASYNEPVPGWIDSVYGPSGLLIGAALGLIRMNYCISSNISDMVPADYVVNSAVVATSDIAKKFEINSEKTNLRIEEEIPIYNYVSQPQKPITLKEFMKMGEKHCPLVPSPLVLWHYVLFLTSSKFLYKLGVIFLHYLPAYIVDFIAMCIGKKPLMVKGYDKIHKFSTVLQYFGMNEWSFGNKNVQMLWRNLSEQDRAIFQFNMGSFDWDKYFAKYVLGCRLYLLKDPIDTLKAGARKLMILRVAHYALCTALIYGAYKLTYFLIVR